MSRQRWSWDEAWHAYTGFVELIARHTVAIVAERGLGLGSGVCVQYGGRHYIATAAHNLEALPLEQLYVITKPDAPLELMSPREFGAHLHRAVFGRRFHPPVDQVRSSDKIDDVALLRLSSIPPEMRHVAFYNLSQRPHRKTLKSLLVVGYPSELVRNTRRGGGTVFLHVESTELANARLRARHYSGSRHFLVEFSRPEGSRDALRSPAGMSGAGVWQTPAPTLTGMWTPAGVQLIGIQSSKVRERPLLVMTRLTRLLRLLR